MSIKQFEIHVFGTREIYFQSYRNMKYAQCNKLLIHSSYGEQKINQEWM